MNLKISYNWLKEYLKTNKSLAEVVRELSLKGQSVEKVEEFKASFKGVITAEILDIQKHPNADKLKLATVNTGKEKLTVVCGAPNITVGQKVPLALVGSQVQSPEKEGELWTVKQAEIRGVKSSGMLCSQKELGLGQDHTGIMILPAETPVGKDVNSLLNLPDSILDVEITANRPDAMSVVGLAREAAACLDQKFVWQTPKPNLKVKQKLPLQVEVKEPKLCPRYLGVVMTGVKVGPSPLWLQLRLLASGLRPINNLVDITNYILLEYGRPMHVFDYDKIAGQKIVVRFAQKGEKILALDGKIYDLKQNHLVIADAKVPVAIGGVMGGQDSAAIETTKTIVFECAIFDPVLIRKTTRELNLRSDSSDLFEKNLPIESTWPGILRAIELTQKLAGGQVASEIIDSAKKPSPAQKIKFNPAEVKRYLGVEIPPAKIKRILDSLGFSSVGNKVLTVTVPWWRKNDVLADYDLVEEIARIYGYHNLPTILPQGQIPIEKKNPLFYWENLTKEVLVGLGFSEVFNYSMISGQLFKKGNLDLNQAVKINNPLNEEMEYLRTSLIPQLLLNLSDNSRHFNEQRIFELSNIYLNRQTNNLPDENLRLGGALTGTADTFLDLKGIVTILLRKLGIIDYQFRALSDLAKTWQAGAALAVIQQGQTLGQFGLIEKSVLETFDLKKPVGLFYFDFEKIAQQASTVKSFKSLPEFPAITRDLSVLLDQQVSWQEVSDLVSKIDPLISALEYLNVFTDQTLGVDKKSLAFRVVLRSNDRTLKSEEADLVIKKIVQKLTETFQAQLR